MTIKEWLQGLANSNQSTDEDSSKMENLLHRVGFPKARVVVGAVYIEGKGRPTDIHSTAKTLLKI